MSQKQKNRKPNKGNSKVSEPEPKVKIEKNLDTTEEINQEEIWQRFELELVWCIQQLESQLTSQKLNHRQCQETTKLITTLSSKKVPLIKKRQVMRSTFGDYRQKMEEEELKLREEMKVIHFSEVNRAKHKGKFLKRSPKQTQLTSQNVPQELPDQKPSNLASTSFVFRKSDNDFRFNFQIPTINDSVNY